MTIASMSSDPEVRDRCRSRCRIRCGRAARDRSHGDVFVAARIATGLGPWACPPGGLKRHGVRAGESPGECRSGWRRGLSRGGLELATADTVEYSGWILDPWASSMRA